MYRITGRRTSEIGSCGKPASDPYNKTTNCLLTMSLALGILVLTPVSHAQDTGEKNEPNSEESELQRKLENGTLIPLVDDDTQMRGGKHGCTIIVTEPGILGSGIENLELSSKIFNGSAAAAQITATNSSYSLSLDPPLGFNSAPANGSSNVNMATSFLGSGATNFSETSGNLDVRMHRGTTFVRTHLSAVRTNNVPFPAGNYTAVVTLRCER